MNYQQKFKDAKKSLIKALDDIARLHGKINDLKIENQILKESGTNN